MLKSILIAVVALAAVACSGEERPEPTQATAGRALNGASARWRFFDAFAALRSQDPGRRLQAVEWIGAHLGAHPVLAREALQAAAGDEAPEVASRARKLLRRLERSR